MAFKLSPVLNDQQFSNAGILLSGGKIETYLAGSTTPATTYTSPSGTVAQANPIILNVRGEVDNLIYLTTGISYKFILKDASNNILRTYDNIEGVNDSSLTIDQWVNSGVTPVFVNATQFTLAGDQTSAFHVNRRVKLLVTAGTVYGYISASVFGALTTVTVVLDSGVLDSGLSSVQLGLITANNTSLRVISAMLPSQIITRDKLANAVYGTGLKGAALASAATTNIFTAADGDLVHITGTVAITSFGTATTAGDYRKLVIDSAGVVITHGANLVCPEGVNIVSSAGDVLVVVADTTTQHRVVSYVRVANKTFSGTFTRNMAAASTTQVITGVGFRPKRVKFYMGTTTAGSNVQYSVGEDNGTYATCVYDSSAVTGATNALDNTKSIRSQGSGGNQTGLISAFSDDGFTITWTLTGAGVAATQTISYVAEM